MAVENDDGHDDSESDLDSDSDVNTKPDSALWRAVHTTTCTSLWTGGSPHILLTLENKSGYFSASYDPPKHRLTWLLCSDPLMLNGLCLTSSISSLSMPVNSSCFLRAGPSPDSQWTPFETTELPARNTIHCSVRLSPTAQLNPLSSSFGVWALLQSSTAGSDVRICSISKNFQF